MPKKKHFRSRLPQSEQLVDLEIITLPVKELSFKNYFLFREYKIMEPEGHEINIKTPYAVEAYSIRYDVIELLANPSNTGNPNKQRIKLYKQVLLTSATFARHSLIEMFLSTAYQTSSFSIQSISPVTSDLEMQILARRLRAWTP